MISLLSIILSFFAGPQVGYSSLHFTEEYIEFRLDNKIFTVNGDYLFINSGDKAISKNISYPFPVDFSLIDSVHVFDKRSGEFLSFKKEQRNIRFNVDLPPHDSAKLNIFYRQELRSDTIIYILTTTKNWGRPLKKAEYTFNAEPEVKVKAFSYKPDKILGNRRHKRYYWKRSDFMPDKDFLIILKKSRP